MSNIRNTRLGKVVSVVLGFATALTLSVGVMAAPQTASALTTEETIAQLLAQITQLQADLAALQTATGGTTTTTAKCAFTKSLTIGSQGSDVTCLQDYLTSAGHYSFSGGSTGYFGPVTRTAVAAWQSANGVSPAVGYFGSLSQAKYNSLVASVTTTTTYPEGCTSATGFSPTTGQSCATTTTTTTYPEGCTSATGFSSTTGQSCSGVTTTTPTGTGLAVASPTQPAATLAPNSAARVPFTKVTLTAGASDVTVTGINVERTNLGSNSNFSGIVLLDEDGTQLGTAKTLNSNNQATVGDTFTVKAGTSKTLTIAGNMAADNSTRAGQIVALTVNGINTSATVSGTLPITGAVHTINGTLSIGSATVERGPLDPSADADSKEIGTKGYTFSSLKVTAGSAEKVRIHSIRWNQSGSAAASDLENVKVYVDGTAYDTVVSSDGKYYSASFGSGLVADKGLSKEISIKGDIVSGSGRTVTFDLYKGTDLDITGETYGYGISGDDGNTTVGTLTGGTFNDELTPAYPAYDVIISAGSVNSISKSNSVPAQNIAVLSPNQPLGAFEVEVRGEPISIQQMIFNLQATGDEAENITSISLVDQNGSVVAGPVDGVSTDANSAYGTVTFTDTVTLPVGKNTLSLKGKLGSAFATNNTVAASTTPSTQWTTITGQSTGETISLSTFSSAITANTMTVKAGALAISASSQPSDRSVIAGAKGFEFARYTLDAGQSGEDIRLANLPLEHTLVTITNSQLSNCNIYDGSNNITDDTNVTLAASTTFTFNDGGLIVPKGTQKTISLKCDLSADATSGTIRWGLSALGSYTGATTVDSNQTVVETATANAGNTMTAATSGSYTVTNDTSLLYKTAQAGTSGVTLAKLRFTSGATEAIDLKQIALELGNTASNSPADLVGERVSLWNGGTQIGTAQFGGANSDNATSTILSPAPRINAGESLLITVKGDLSAHNVNEGTPGAFLAITYDGNNNGTNGNHATGVDSNTTIDGGTTSDVTTNGLRIFRTVPSIAVTSNGGTLTAGANLYSFTVTNPNDRDVVFNKFSFSVATSGSAAINAFTLYGDNVAFNTTATSTVASETLLEFEAADESQAKIVPANSSKTYVVKAATVTNPSTTVVDSITLALLADTSYPSLADLMGTVATIEAGDGNTDNIIWSPFSTTTPVATLATESNLDWTNGYGLPGFPSNTAFSVQTWQSAN